MEIVGHVSFVRTEPVFFSLLFISVSQLVELHGDVVVDQFISYHIQKYLFIYSYFSILNVLEYEPFSISGSFGQKVS
jgi:hypothetical protein